MIRYSRVGDSDPNPNPNRSWRTNTSSFPSLVYVPWPPVGGRFLALWTIHAEDGAMGGMIGTLRASFVASPPSASAVKSSLSLG